LGVDGQLHTGEFVRLADVKLTVTVITYNEADHIQQALESVAWADEIIVVDSGSTDGTADLARARATQVIVRGWPGYSEQKNFAADSASNDWVLSLDADERITPELAAEIRGMLSGVPQARGYRIRRVSRYLGRWIRSTDWFPDYQLRLYDRRAGCWNGLRIHESFRLNSAAPGKLQGELHHYAYRDISHHLKKIDTYTTLLAEQSHEQEGEPTLSRWRSTRASRSSATTCFAWVSWTARRASSFRC